jgi:hypothetical protein
MKVGDRVVIVTREYEDNSNAPHYEIHGKITEKIERKDSTDIFLVNRDGMSPPIDRIWYAEDDLIPEKNDYPMVEPDFSLEEIELGRQLIEG